MGESGDNDKFSVIFVSIFLREIKGSQRKR
jgi:hypothetical protein